MSFLIVPPDGVTLHVRRPPSARAISREIAADAVAVDCGKVLAWQAIDGQINVAGSILLWLIGAPPTPYTGRIAITGLHFSVPLGYQAVPLPIEATAISEVADAITRTLNGGRPMLWNEATDLAVRELAAVVQDVNTPENRAAVFEFRHGTGFKALKRVQDGLHNTLARIEGLQ